MSQEIWKTIDNFSNYEISSCGNIKNKTTNNILTPNIRSGYANISIKNDENKYVHMRAHRLVALAFIPNIDNKLTVNHKDHNKLNNNVDNLEWSTHSEQNFHKRKPKKDIQELVSSRPVWRIDKDTNEKLEYYKTIRFAAQWVFDNNLTSVKEFDNGNNIKTKISAVCQKKYGRNTSFGFKWEYCDENIKFDDEEWRDIPCDIINGVKGYKITNYGRLKNHKGRITEGSIKDDDYPTVVISSKQYRLHRLVALVFIPNPENKEQVNHIDGNKQNACVNNLEWCSNQENSIHKVNTGLSNITKKIIQYDLQMNKIKEFNSQMDAARELNIHGGNISKVCMQKQKTCRGWIFKFAE